MLSNYPDGTWEGDPDAPWNEEEPTRTCRHCTLCKDVRLSQNGLTEYVGTCVREVWEAEDEEGLDLAELQQVDLSQEACDGFIDDEM